MTQHTRIDDGANKAVPRRRRRVALASSGLALIALVAAGCSGGGDGPGVAGAANTTSTTADPSGNSGGILSGGDNGPSPKQQAELLKFSECMRSHGISDFPDPSDGGLHISASPNSDINPQSPQFQAAQSACSKYMPGADLTPAQKAAANAKALKFAQCMQSHGEPNFPDPNGEGVIRITNANGVLDPNSSQFEAAQKACQSFNGGFMMQITSGGQLPGAGNSGPGTVGSGNSGTGNSGSGSASAGSGT